MPEGGRRVILLQKAWIGERYRDAWQSGGWFCKGLGGGRGWKGDVLSQTDCIITLD